MAVGHAAHQPQATYRLTLPTNLQAAQIQAWLRSASGSRRSTMSLELWANDHGLTHRLSVPIAQADYIVGQLRTLVPGVRVVPDTTRTIPAWTAAVELTLTDMTRTLMIPAAEQASASLLASVQGLKAGETMLWQVVVRPAAPEKIEGKQKTSKNSLISWLASGDRDEPNDRRDKLSEPNYLAVLRVAVQAETEGQAVHLLSRVQSALASVRTPDNAFRKRLTFTKTGVMRRIAQASGSLLYSAQFSVTELAALIGWPIGSPHVAGLPSGGTRQLPATGAIPRSGLVIGRSNFPGDERPVALAYKDAAKHLHILGPTGTGKTTLLANLAKQIMQKNHGLIILESKGDLFDMGLAAVPRRRIKDVIVLDVNDTSHPIGFNILSAGTSRAAVDELSALITGIYGDHGGVYAPMLLYFGLHALAEMPGSTFIDLPAMLTPQGPEETAWRDEVVRNVKNHDVRQFWQRYLDDRNKERDRMAVPVHNRIWQRLVAAWVSYRGVPDRHLADAQRAIEVWTQALKLRS